MSGFHSRRYVLCALLAASLFGSGAPFAKLLLGGASPQMLAGLLYLGSGLGLSIFFLAGRRLFRGEKSANGESALRGRDWAWLTGATLAGGVAAPVLLLMGLNGAAASEASLLLNLESPMTALFAAILFGEAVGGRVWLASLVMAAAGFLLAYDPRVAWNISPDAAAVAGACLMWGLDNNLTRHISARDPAIIAIIKGWVAGSVNTGLAYAAGASFPAGKYWFGAVALGTVGYGASLVLFVYALRHLGSSRAGACFGAAPFFGAAASVALLGEPVTVPFATAFVLMLVAAGLIFAERHAHEHAHEYLVHAHRHRCDSHHGHEHRGDEGPEPHAHEHAHEPLVHSHPHAPDIHHRHKH